jgi:intracellular septation protein
MSPALKLILDLGPLLVFFLMYKFAGLLWATAALIACTLLSLSIIYIREKRVAAMPLVSAVAVTIFGGLTLVLHDELFIKMKPTFVNILFAVILFSGLYLKKPLLKYLLSDALAITDRGWQLLSLRWACFFLFLAALNEVIWRHFPTDFWVNFKVFGMFTLTMLFTFCQLPLIQKHWKEEPHD